MADRHRVGIAVLGGTTALDLAVAVQAFGRRPAVFHRIRPEPESPYEITLCGRAGVPTFGELRPMSELAAADTVVVPGVDDPLAARDPEVLEAIAVAAERGARLLSLCAGAFVLGYAGVLHGHRVTTHWALADDFRAEFPRVELAEHELYVDDGQVLASGGMLAAADLCLHVLRTDHGQAYANDMSRLLVSPPHRTGGQSQYSKVIDRPLTGSLAPVLEWMLAHLDEPLTLRSVAAHAHMSTRTLARRFRAETGQSLLDWVVMRRVERARELLEESDLTVTQIAYAAGFGSTESLRRHFLLSSGTSPGAYRATFRLAAG
ncbi:transcriptional regulator GlxA family with amidase domain [Kribbella amoyensis]|uniref:Transcriptional regulator GlxA family with amidase domain n=1 Tax=Kribbella amoyensis TaxID=996641 RepID=A0A561BUR2_9ACTN|nr:helix-turn-helix domain-containing protein [Kribbella amoyensis]TWD82609.1 transcriptional regulator GlxA family with amidase domain [Kribbella amoyensis]